MSTLERFMTRFDDESGDSEIITALLVLPMIIWLIFSTIDVSLYMNTRSSVQNAARDAARQVAVYGGDNSRLNPYAPNTVALTARNTLWNGSKCTPSACKQAPEVTCTPTIVAKAGDVVSCTIKYYYTTAASGNPISGFAGFLNKPFTVTETARAEVGYSR